MKFDKTISFPCVTDSFIEIKKKGGKLACIIYTVISIVELRDNYLLLLSHFGKIEISGANLNICIFRKGAVEIFGNIEEVRFV